MAIERKGIKLFPRKLLYHPGCKKRHERARETRLVNVFSLDRA